MEQEQIKIAEELVDEIEKSRLPEQYREVAFRTLLEYRLGTRAITVEPTKIPKFPAVTEEMSFSEFLNQIGEPKTNPQKFAGVAFYYERFRQEGSVTQEDIVNTMTDAGLRAPANFPRDMRLATSTKNALMMPSREPKNGASAWQLTRTGRQFIEKLYAQ